MATNVTYEKQVGFKESRRDHAGECLVADREGTLPNFPNVQYDG